ncbi:MAG: hypothetical protein HWN66_11715 [Candidatus Helarchaeota archaeon]|nr:hypothetical protein [Candidatus Helarchaeota archaeon]
MIIESGKISAFVITVLTIIVAYYFTYRASQGKLPKIRRMPALEVIDEAVLRCVEMGRTCHLNPGQAPIYGIYGPMTVAGLTVMKYTARKCAELDAPMIASFENPQTMALAMEQIREVYTLEGKASVLTDENWHFIPGQAYRLSVWGVNMRRNVGALVGVGAYWGANLPLFESAKIGGAMTIGGTARMVQIPVIAVVADYTLIGEELYACQAYIEKDPLNVSHLAAEDVIKFLTIATFLVGSLLVTAGNDIIRILLNM